MDNYKIQKINNIYKFKQIGINIITALYMLFILLKSFFIIYSPKVYPIPKTVIIYLQFLASSSIFFLSLLIVTAKVFS